MPTVLVAGPTTMKDSLFLPFSSGCYHCQYSLHLPTEGQPAVADTEILNGEGGRQWVRSSFAKSNDSSQL